MSILVRSSTEQHVDEPNEGIFAHPDGENHETLLHAVGPNCTKQKGHPSLSAFASKHGHPADYMYNKRSTNVKSSPAGPSVPRNAARSDNRCHWEGEAHQRGCGDL